MIAVQGVQVAVMEVVHVIPVLNRLVTAVRAVGVLSQGVLGDSVLGVGFNGFHDQYLLGVKYLW